MHLSECLLFIKNTLFMNMNVSVAVSVGIECVCVCVCVSFDPMELDQAFSYTKL